MAGTVRRVQRSDRPRFGTIVVAEGEDPARFLATDMDLRPRIHGLETVSLVHAWRAVERQLYDGGRDAVLEALDEREAELR